VFKEIADKIYSQDLQLNKKDVKKIYLASQEAGQFPLIQAGKVDELQLICNKFGISNHYKGQDESWVKSVAMQKSIQWKANQVEAPVVPDVSGMSLRDALYVLENKGLRVVYQGRGRVRNQSVSPGAPLQNYSIISLVLG